MNFLIVEIVTILLGISVVINTLRTNDLQKEVEELKTKVESLQEDIWQMQTYDYGDWQSALKESD